LGCQRTVWLCGAEHLANPPFGGIPHHGATEASRRNNAETIDAVSIRQSQQDHVAASNTASTFLHGDKLCA
jgi:hypothetical protein